MNDLNLFISFYFFYFILFLTLQYYIGFAIYMSNFSKIEI